LSIFIYENTISKGYCLPVQAMPDERTSRLVEENGKIIIELSDNAIRLIKGRISELNPVIAVGFDLDRLAVGLDTVNKWGDNDRPTLPTWMLCNSYPVTGEQFQASVMRCCSEATSGGVIDSFMIGPNSGADDTRATAALVQICKHPYLRALANSANGPLGKVYFIYSSTRRSTPEAANLYHMDFPDEDFIAFV
jgi:hypothetical protein